MTVLTAETERLDARGISHASGFRVEFVPDWKQALSLWKGTSTATLFQHPHWLDAWYAAFAGADHVEPVIALVYDASTGEQALLLPLIRRLDMGIRIVEFADLGLTDYNAPILGEAAPHNSKAASALWVDLKTALQRMAGGADLLRFRKMPVQIAGRPNPFALLAGTGPCSVNGNIVITGDDFDAWRFTLERTVRKEIERSWRVFMRGPSTAFRIIDDKNEALQFLAATELQQGSRMRQLGLNYFLNNETSAAFYRGLVRDGIDSGYAVVSALTSGNEVVATLIGIRNAQGYVMVRISNAGEKWTNCSPGRLVIERTMAALHKEGVREFDFSIGDYPYKRRFGVRKLELVNKTAALTWRGLPYALRDQTAYEIRKHPRLEAHLKGAMKKLRSREAIAAT